MTVRGLALALWIFGKARAIFYLSPQTAAMRGGDVYLGR